MSRLVDLLVWCFSIVKFVVALDTFTGPDEVLERGRSGRDGLQTESSRKAHPCRTKQEHTVNVGRPGIVCGPVFPFFSLLEKTDLF